MGTKIRATVLLILIWVIAMLAVPLIVQNLRAKPTQEALREELRQPQIWQVLMAEAVSEGYDGMYAVACVIRNRGGNLNGFYGAKRKDLDDFCRRQGSYIALAKSVEKRVFKNGGTDITHGATHFENIGRFGNPYWTKEMIITVKIGNHTFYRRR